MIRSFDRKLILMNQFQSLESKKMADWTAKATKIEEIARKKDELNIEFINQTKELLDAKMEYHVEKRDALMSDMKKKLKVCTSTTSETFH